jgi:hypothetical protein
VVLRLEFDVGFPEKKSKRCFNGDGIVYCNPYTFICKYLTWHTFIGWCKSPLLHNFLIEFNLKWVWADKAIRQQNKTKHQAKLRLKALRQ